ncbi:MAG: ATP-binding protein [Deltaproteobacteria bacterium]|nr:ATP-binding protein [Deltaproteobacteria bacterium]
MRKIIKDSVRFRIMIATLIPVIFIFLTIIPVSYYYLKSGFDKEIENRLISVASLISTIPNIEYAADLKEGDEDLVSFDYLVNKLRAARDTASLKTVFVFDRDGRLLVSSEGEKIGKKIIRLEIDRKETELVFENNKVSSVLFKGEDGFYYKNAYVPLIYSGEKVIAALGVSASVTYFETLNNIRDGILLIVLISLMLITMIIIIVSKGISRPVADMINQAKLIAKGDFETKLNTRTYGELAILVDTFEQMRERIMNRNKRQQMMLSGIAHEIRNPLGGMQLMIDLLLEKFSEDEEVSKLVMQMNNELRYLGNVVNSFLSYSKNINIEKTRVSIASVINETIDVLQSDLDRKSIEIKKDLQDVEIISDNDILKQVLINILLNSVQAVSDKGLIEIKCSKEGERAVVTVKDNGTGIKPEDMKLIFRPFFTTKEKGTGLGLALVKKYINQLGGDITVESEYLRGCVVRIYLPLF